MNKKSKQVLTVTLNPVLDTFVNVQKKSQKDFLIRNSRTQAGGKGVNVARVLKKFRCKATALGFSDETIGNSFVQSLVKEKIDFKHIPIASPIRQSISYIDPGTKATRRTFTSDPQISKKEESAFMKLFEKELPMYEAVVLSGSIPQGCDEHIYARLIKKATAKQCQSVLDSRGQAFANGVNAKPNIIKPNLQEAEEFIGDKLNSRKKQLAVIKDFHAKGVGIVLLSNAAKGLLASDTKNVLQIQLPDFKIKQDVGCGDALVAGFIYALLKNYAFAKAAQFSVATAAMVGADPELRLTNAKNALELMDKTVLKHIT